MDLKFKLHSKWPFAGDQPGAVKKLTSILAEKSGKAVLLGVTGSGKTMLSSTIG